MDFLVQFLKKTTDATVLAQAADQRER